MRSLLTSTALWLFFRWLPVLQLLLEFPELELSLVEVFLGHCLLKFVLGFFGINMPFIHESGLIGIGFSLFVVVIAALNLVLDFDFIESGAEAGAPKFMEWYAAFGLMVTLIWLYLEILRLLAKLRGRN